MAEPYRVANPRVSELHRGADSMAPMTSSIWCTTSHISRWCGSMNRSRIAASRAATKGAKYRRMSTKTMELSVVAQTRLYRHCQI